MNEKLGVYGMALVAMDGQSSEQADITITVSANSACGGAADGVLGCTERAGEITLISGWNFYAGADSGAIGADQYDFQTIITHEVGHSVGLDHSGDANSVMYEMLATGETRRALTAQDLVLLEQEAAEGPVALMAAPSSSRNTNQRHNVVSSAVAFSYAADLVGLESHRRDSRPLSRGSAGVGLPVFAHGDQAAAQLRAFGGRRIDTFWRGDFLLGVGVDDPSFGGRGLDAMIQGIAGDRVADGEQESQSPFGENADTQLVDRCLEELLSDGVVN